jgi:hypothetical protein
MENKHNINLFENVIEKLYHSIDDINLFFEINHLLIKKIIKNPETIINANKNINSEEFIDKLKESQNKFINWLLSN